MAKKHAARPIDELVAQRIRELHKKHSALGHDGIGKLLASEGINVDAHELRAFMQNKKMRVASTRKWENGSDVMGAFGAGLTKKGEGFD